MGSIPIKVSFDPPSVAPSGSSVLEVEISSAAPAGGANVSLSWDPASGPYVGAPPASLTIAEGEVTGTTSVQISGTAGAGDVEVEASHGGGSKAGKLAIT